MKIFKGDDTGGRLGKALTITVHTKYDLTDCLVFFNYQGITRKWEGVKDGDTLDLFFSHNETARMSVGTFKGTMFAVDPAGKYRTIDNAIPITVTTSLRDCYGDDHFDVVVGVAINWDDIVHKPFEGQEIDIGTDDKVLAALGTIIEKLGGTVKAGIALVALYAMSAFGYTPETHTNTFVRNGVTYAQRGGMNATTYVVTNVDMIASDVGAVDTNSVRDIAREEIVPATNRLNQTLSDALDDKRDKTDNVCHKTEYGDKWIASNPPEGLGNTQPYYDEAALYWVWWSEDYVIPYTADGAPDAKSLTFSYNGTIFTAIRSAVCSDGKRFVTEDFAAKKSDIFGNDGKPSDIFTTNLLGKPVANIKANSSAFAPEYDAASEYAVGEFVWRDGNIYQCKTAIAGGGEPWNAGHWELKKLYDILSAKADKSQLDVLGDKRDKDDLAVYKLVKSAFVLHKDGLTDVTLPFIGKDQGKPYPYSHYDWVFPIEGTTSFNAIVFSDGQWKLNVDDGMEYGYSSASEDALRIEFDNGYVATRSSIISAVPVDDQQLAAVATGDTQTPSDGDLVKYDAANGRLVKAEAGTDYARQDDVEYLINVHGTAISNLENNKADRATTLSGYGITDATPLSMISETDPTFSNAVLSVGLNIDTNSVAVLNEIASTFGGLPIEGTATTVGGLLAALAAAIAWLKKNKVQTLKLEDNSVETSADGGVAKLDDFFTGSNSLLTGTIDARLPYPLYTVPSTGILKDRAINTTSLASVTVPDNFTDLLVRASVASSLSVTMPETVSTKYGDTFPCEAGEYLITITKTGAAEAYVRTIKLEEVA